MLTYSEFNYGTEGIRSYLADTLQAGRNHLAHKHFDRAEIDMAHARDHMKSGDHEKAAHYMRKVALSYRKHLSALGKTHDSAPEGYEDLAKFDLMADRLEKGDIEGAQRLDRGEEQVTYKADEVGDAMKAGGITLALGEAAFMAMVAKGVPAFKKVYKAIKDKRMTAREAKEELKKEGWLYRNGKWVAIGVGGLGTTAGVTGIYLERRHKK